jgi:hypothetical protein
MMLGTHIATTDGRYILPSISTWNLSTNVRWNENRRCMLLELLRIRLTSDEFIQSPPSSQLEGLLFSKICHFFIQIRIPDSFPNHFPVWKKKRKFGKSMYIYCTHRAIRFLHACTSLLARVATCTYRKSNVATEQDTLKPNLCCASFSN